MKKRLINTRSNQRGLTLISWMVVIVFALSQVIIAMNVLPVYMTDSTVKTVLEGMTTDVSASNMTTKELKSSVLKRLNISSVYSIKPEHVKVKKGRNESTIIVDYEPRGAIIGNLEYIVHFQHEVKVKSR
ncbi:hypothetical protein MNBD_GAMMA05-197 [hydrothermal vent metagenome]|uniref:DUF4845 domain-containing protein n=1 Tax=hydrothermal vent metagenome TaxID=652676 RepID=A0A3B0WH03_9ZZZZ